jgi:GNAT superfamily N-acetyltransferase
LRDHAGRPVLSYLEGTRDGRRWAHGAGVLDAGASRAVISQLSGWYVSADLDFAATLIAGGAEPIRHAHRMNRDLRADPPPPEWARPTLPAGIRLGELDRPTGDIFPVLEAAFPNGHPDRAHIRSSVDERESELTALLAGRVLGPVAASSALAVDATDRVVGMIAVCTRTEEGTVLPWIGTVFRRPGAELRGLGDRMIRRALALTAAEGRAGIGLAVTEGNPARRLYERLGFAVVATSMTVRVP